MALLTVTNTSGSATTPGSLPYEVAHAMPGDAIVVSPQLANQTITLGATLAIPVSVTITAPSVTLAGGGFNGPIVSIAPGTTTAISGVTFEGGSDTGAAGTAGTVSASGTASPGSAGADAAGGILNSGNLTLADDSFVDDIAQGGAGGSGANPYFGTANQVGSNGGNGGNAAGAIYDEAGSSLTYASGSVTFTGDAGTGGAGGANGISTDATGAPTAFFSPGVAGSGGADVGGVPATIGSPCFAAGTMIRTPDGEVAVETLKAGDLVLRADGVAAPIVWVGHRRVQLHLHPAPFRVLPVRVRRDALGRGVPSRDLVLSPDHALSIDGRLIPAGLLENGVSIVRDFVERVVYHHLELERHAVILAENAPVESYLDTGNRFQFANAAMTSLVPDFWPGTEEGMPCAEMLFDGPELEAIRQRLDRAARRRLTLETKAKSGKKAQAPRNTGDKGRAGRRQRTRAA